MLVFHNLYETSTSVVRLTVGAFLLGYIPLAVVTMVAAVLDCYDCRWAQRSFVEEQLAGPNAGIGMKPTMYSAVEKHIGKRQ